MIKKIIFIFSILLLINFVVSVDPIIKQVIKPTVDTYASSICSVNFQVLVDYPGKIYVNWGSPSVVNGSLQVFTIYANVPIGKAQPVTYQVIDATVYPQLTWNFNTTLDCEPIPTNFTMIAKQNTWISSSSYGSLSWMKILQVPNTEKILPNDAFVCTVPEPFYCVVGSFLSGAKILNYLAQIVIYSNNNAPYQPFNVIISDKQGRVLHNSTFDGLSNPANPPLQITNVQAFPSNGSTVETGEMLKSAMYTMSILNKNSYCTISSSSDYFISNTLLPLLGTPANASYVGFTSLQYIKSPLVSHLSIIDNQGSKRIGSDNVLNAAYKQYNTSVDEPSYSIVENSNINSSIINIKANTKYNPNSYISSSVQYETKFPLDYPFGYSNGTVQYHSISVSLAIAKTNKNNYPYFAFVSPYSGDINVGSNGYSAPYEFTSNVTDNAGALVKKVEVVNLSFEKVLVRVYASDLDTGIAFLYYTNLRKVLSSDIVYGDNYNGVYEAIEEFDTFYGSSIPSITLIDGAQNFQQYGSGNKIYDTNLNSLPEYPSYKYINDKNLEPFNFTAFEFKYNDIDVSNSAFNNTLCFNIVNSNKTMLPRFLGLSNPLNHEALDLKNAIVGSWDEIKGMFCVDFQIPARIFTGEYLYILILTPYVYDTYYLTSSIGKQAQLRVTSSYGDQMPPVITQFSAFPSNNVTINSNTNVGWDIRIEDSPNGMVSAEFNITSDYDLQPYTIKITPANATSGNINSGTYQLRIPINSNTCRSQSFRITSAAIKDTQGHTSLLPSNLNINPFFKFLNSDQLILNITCPQAIIDGSSPVLTSFTSSANSIDLGAYKDFRNITFTFKTTDSGSGISLRHNPVIYLFSKDHNRISKVSTLVSFANNIATYTCTIQLPYGYGAYNNILISIYGIVDNQLNINGYSSVDLQSMGFQSTIKVLYSDVPVLDSTSSINSNGSSITIYGHKFGINQNNITFQIDYQNGQGFINTPISFFSGIVLMTNSITPTSTPFYVRVIVNGKTSNALLVTPTIVASPCKYEVTQSVVSTWINSEKYPYLQASITIKNTGTRPIKLFSFIMDNIDQIWGVTVNGNRYTLPSYNEIINPRDQYSFGYIIKGTTVGDLQQITYQCL